MRQLVDFDGAFTICIVQNTDTAGSEGEHWICFYLPCPNTYYYYDSIGNPLEFYKVVLPIGTCVAESCARTHGKSNLCGAYCLFVLFQLCMGVSFGKAIGQFTLNAQHNDVMISKFLLQLTKGISSIIDNEHFFSSVQRALL